MKVRKCYCVIFGIIVLLSAGCNSFMAENSYGYDYFSYNSMTENREKEKKRPDWFHGEWTKWKSEKEKVDNKEGFVYFRGISAPNNYNKIHSYVMAREETYSSVLKDLSVIIGSELNVYFERNIEELGRNTENAGEVKNLLDQQVKLSLLVETEFKTFVQGLEPYEEYSEKWMNYKKKMRIDVYKVWKVYRISKADIEVTRNRLLEERSAVQDELAKQRNIERRQEIIFQDLSSKFNILEMEINDFNISQEDKIKKHREIVEVYLRLEGLITQADKPEYKILNERVKEQIIKHDPADVVNSLQRQLIASNATITELRRQNDNQRIIELEQRIADGQGYTLETQTIIISFPQKPIEIEIPEVNILASRDMVTNIDYISFTNINGVNNLARSRYGLYAPAVSVSWNDAARYCNWLSRLYGLVPCYNETGGRITGYNNKRNGFRLPEEHEITAILQLETDVIDHDVFSEIGIWSSTDFPLSFLAYKLSGGTGAAAVERLMFQSIDRIPSDAEIGFRIVRNAR